MAKLLWRTLITLHRYLGVAVGLLMVMWFISGIVMMYVPFPRVTDEERARILLPIPWQGCCQFGEREVGDGEAIIRGRVENLAGAPVMRLQRPGHFDTGLDLSQGAAPAVDAERAKTMVLDAAPRIIGRPAAIVATDRLDVDQWIVGRLFRDRPLYRFDFDDTDRTSIYVSGKTGQVMHWTTATQQFWNWLGTIPHWLYFTELRKDVAMWSQIVVWTSVLGTFLTLIGLYLGIAQFRRGKNGKVSPYRGLFWWHHWVGLVFGVVTLTWVVSGLVSMNPWGFLEGRRGGGEGARLEGPAPKWSEVRASLEVIHSRPVLANVVSLATAPYATNLFWLATEADGKVTRLDAAGNVAPLAEPEFARAAARIAGTTEIASQGLMNEEDAYYFGRRDAAPLPVYRIILNDADRTRYYIDAVSGALLRRADANGRVHRWLFSGLHRIDFTAWLRASPQWDIITLVLMLGGVGVTGTGVYLAIRRIRLDAANALRRLRRLMNGGARLPQSAGPASG